MDLRKVYGGYYVDVKKGETLRIEKYCNVYTARDFDMQEKTVADIQALSLEKVKELAGIGYGKLALDTAAEWEKQVWSTRRGSRNLRKP